MARSPRHFCMLQPNAGFGVAHPAVRRDAGNWDIKSPAESVRGDDATAEPQNDPARGRGGRGSFFVSLKAMDWLWPRGTIQRAGAGRIAAAAAGPAHLEHHCPRRDRAHRHSRRRRSRRAAHLRGQGRQSGVADPAERRHRLDRVARADHRDRRPGCAVAGDAADGNAECHGLAVRRRPRARSATRSAACSAAMSPSRSAA